MDTILQEIFHVILCYIHDILVTGMSEEGHMHNLEEVLRRFQQHRVQLKAKKCMCLWQDSVK